MRGDDDLLQKGILAYEGRLKLTPGSKAYEEFCLKAFEKSGIEDNLISSIPKMYYMDWYSYKADPVFWSDLLFTVPLEERLTGRQFQTYFMNVKWGMADSKMKLFGMGYTPFMNGSILLEQDFIQQKYTLGYLGDLLLAGPWLILTVVGAVFVLLRWKKCMNGDHGSGYIRAAAGSSVSQRSYIRSVCYDDVHGADRGDSVGSGFWSS